MAKELRNVWLWLSSGDLRTELRQLEDEGRDTSRFRAKLERLAALGDEQLFLPANQEKVGALLDAAQKLPMRKGYAFDEPSDLPGIRRRRPRGPRRFAQRLSDKALLDRIMGAWLGRCVGCLLGKAAEGVRTGEFWPFLQLTGQFPIADYIRFGARGKAAKQFPQFARRAWCDNIDHMPIDDDTNYTTTGYLIVKQHGADFTPADVAQFWMGNLPLLATCTAERVAYRNFALQVQPPASGSFRNPYREWIGAQIRADLYGYVALGDPARAAELAWRDASISHTRNGIYGAMWVAGMLASAAGEADVRAVIEAGLRQIPRTSRLTEGLRDVLGWHAAGVPYAAAVEAIHRRWDETVPHAWCHTVANAQIVAVGLLYGEGDFGRAVTRAVGACLDTDCNGATVGSIMGMMLGREALPRRWTDVLRDTLHTSLPEHPACAISELAEQTYRLHLAAQASR